VTYGLAMMALVSITIFAFKSGFEKMKPGIGRKYSLIGYTGDMFAFVFGVQAVVAFLQGRLWRGTRKYIICVIILFFVFFFPTLSTEVQTSINCTKYIGTSNYRVPFCNVLKNEQLEISWMDKYFQESESDLEINIQEFKYDASKYFGQIQDSVNKNIIEIKRVNSTNVEKSLTFLLDTKTKLKIHYDTTFEVASMFFNETMIEKATNKYNKMLEPLYEKLDERISEYQRLKKIQDELIEYRHNVLWYLNFAIWSMILISGLALSHHHKHEVQVMMKLGPQRIWYMVKYWMKFGEWPANMTYARAKMEKKKVRFLEPIPVEDTPKHFEQNAKVVTVSGIVENKYGIFQKRGDLTGTINGIASFATAACNDKSDRCN